MISFIAGPQGRKRRITYSGISKQSVSDQLINKSKLNFMDQFYSHGQLVGQGFDSPFADTTPLYTICTSKLIRVLSPLKVRGINRI